MKHSNRIVAARTWFFAGVMAAATFGAFASLSPKEEVRSTMAPTQDVSEIRAQRQADLAFDRDFARLSATQGRYRENLPLRKKTKAASARRVGQR